MTGSENATAADQTRSADARSEKQTRERSRIEFAYADLENAVEMVRTLHTRSGARCEVNQLAIWLNQTASGGTFRTRLSASKIFGLIETDRGFVSLTDLGLSIVDQGAERGARTSGF